MDRQENILQLALEKCRSALHYLIGYSAAINILMLTSALYMLQVYDRVLPGRSMDTLALLTILAATAMLAMALLDFVRASLLQRVSRWLDGELRGPLFNHMIEKASLDPRVGSRALGDLSSLRSFICGSAAVAIIDTPWIPIYLITVWILHPYVGIMATLGAALLFVIAILNARATQDKLDRTQKAQFKALARANSATNNADVAMAMGMLPALSAKWTVDAEDVAKKSEEANAISARFTSASKFLRQFMQVLVLGIGAYLVIEGEMTAGTMIAGSILMGRALAPVDQTVGAWRGIVNTRQSYDRLVEFVKTIELEEASIVLPPPDGPLEVEGLIYAFPGQSSPILKGINFKLNPGEAMAIIGPTAGGKTTLIRHLAGVLKPNRGAARLAGADLATWDSNDRGQYIGYLPQDIELFDGSVKENIARFKDADDEAIINAAQLANVHEMIMRLPKGYETQIGPGGASLSGGQRQRLALARAFFGPVKLLLLDEPNANLDNAGEEALLKAIKIAKANGMITVMVSHRPSIVQYFDKVLILKDGIVEKFGPVAEILPKIIPKSANGGKGSGS